MLVVDSVIFLGRLQMCCQSIIFSYIFSYICIADGVSYFLVIKDLPNNVVNAL